MFSAVRYQKGTTMTATISRLKPKASAPSPDFANLDFDNCPVRDLLNHIGGKSGERSAFIPGTGRVIREEDLARLLVGKSVLAEGDTIKDGKIVDASGEEVPVVTASQEVIVQDAIKQGKIKSRDDVRRVILENGE